MMSQQPKRKVINFGAGPAKLPEEVLKEVQNDLLNFNNTQISICELSHRSSEYAKVNQDAQDCLRELLSIPDNYKILFMHGGGTALFAAVALNLMFKKDAHYLITGTWSKKAAKEASKFGPVDKIVSYDTLTENNTGISDQFKRILNPEASYLYYCANETIEGIEFDFIPECKDIPLVVDMSSNFLTRKFDVSKFGLIFAGAQKNFGPSGVVVVIIREDLLKHSMTACPSILDFSQIATENSILNTPSTFQVYFIGRVFHWIKKNGGVEQMEKLAIMKSKMIYDIIEKSNGFYVCPIEKKSRSRINIPFRIGNNNEELEKKFLTGATELGMLQLKGHRSVGGIRVSLYNAITIDETKFLANYMEDFHKKYANSIL